MMSLLDDPVGRDGFADRLAVTLTLTIGGTAHVIAGGNVKELALDLRSYGFSGSLAFLVQDDHAHGGDFTDDLITAFLKPDLIEVAVAIAAVLVTPEAGEIQPIRLTGLVLDKSVSEIVFRRLAGAPVLVRRYRIAFADPARVLWTQHFPCQLYTDTSMVDVINDHLGDRIVIKYELSALTQPRRLVFLHLPRAAHASFADFVSWYLDACGGVLSYDYATASYLVAATKPDAGAPRALFGDDIARAELHYPAVPRYAPVVSNSNADSPRREPIAQAQAQIGIRSDILLRTPIAQRVDDEIALQRALAVIPCCEAHVQFGRVPSGALTPGALVALPAANRWSAESALVGATWRVRRLRLGAVASSPSLDHDLQLPSTGYQVAVSAELEAQAEPRIDRPRFCAPSYPGAVEGKVVCEQGKDGDKTYQIYVPLWDKVVSAPFEPIFGSGNIYLPSYRAERVLLAIDVHGANIAQLLEWRAGAPLPMDAQGEHILFGKSEDSQTSVNHVYDGDKPVFNVARTHQRDTALIQLREGTLLLQVKEQEEG